MSFEILAELLFAKYTGNYYHINKIRRKWNENGTAYYDNWKYFKSKHDTDAININYHIYVSFLIATKLVDLIESTDDETDSIKYKVIITKDDWKNFVGIDYVIDYDTVIKSFLDTILYCPLKFWADALHSKTISCEAYISDSPTNDYDHIVIEWVID